MTQQIEASDVLFPSPQTGAVFVVPWRYLAASEHQACFYRADRTCIGVLTNGVDFTISPDGDVAQNVGTLTLTATVPADAAWLYLRRNTQKRQDYAATPGAEGAEASLDRNTMAAQDLRTRMMPAILEDGAIPIYNQATETFDNGPDGGAIVAAEANAIRAETAQQGAEAVLGGAQTVLAKADEATQAATNAAGSEQSAAQEATQALAAAGSASAAYIAALAAVAPVVARVDQGLRLANRRIATANETYIPASTVSAVRFVLQGAGGNGGTLQNATGSTEVASGGGCGGYVDFLNFAPVQSGYTIQFDANGTHVIDGIANLFAGVGPDGLSATLAATGYVLAATPLAISSGPANALILQAGAAPHGMAVAGQPLVVPHGADSILGRGGVGRIPHASGIQRQGLDANGFGAGGGGSATWSVSATATAPQGSPGCVIIEEYVAL